jgi:hypothetical protein
MVLGRNLATARVPHGGPRATGPRDGGLRLGVQARTVRHASDAIVRTAGAVDGFRRGARPGAGGDLDPRGASRRSRWTPRGTR